MARDSKLSLSARRRATGFSLIELMVAVLVGLIGILVMTQVFLDAEGLKRTTTGSSDAQTSGLTAAYLLERDIRMAGYGTMAMGCTNVRIFLGGTTQIFSGLPVTIKTDDPTANTDSIQVLYSQSAFGSIPSTLQSPMPTSSANVRVDNGMAYNTGELIMISQPPQDCSVLQMSQDGQHLGVANVTGPGTQWDLQHNSGGSFPYNPPGGFNIFPTGGYTTGAKVSDFGAMVNHKYYISNNNLVMEDLNNPTASAAILVNDVIALRAYYGRDTSSPPDGIVDTWDTTVPTDSSQLLAVRIAVVARSGQYEKNAVTPYIRLWSGVPNIMLASADQHYRYRVFTTTVPLRNVIWH